MTDDITLTRSLYGDLAPDEEGQYLFDDTTVSGWIRLAGGNPYRAAAMACRALSVDQAYLLKVVRTQDYQVNGAAIASELRLIATDLDNQANHYELENDDSFEVFDMGTPNPLVPEGSTFPWGF